jgi:hypothetical protein
MELVIELYVCTDWGQLFKKLVKTILLWKSWAKLLCSTSNPAKKVPLFLIVIDLDSALIVIDLDSALIVIVWAQRW